MVSRILGSIATITRENRDSCYEQTMNGEEAHDGITFAQESGLSAQKA